MAVAVELKITEAPVTRARLLENTLDELVDTLEVYDSMLPQPLRDRTVEARKLLEELRA